MSDGTEIPKMDTRFAHGKIETPDGDIVEGTCVSVVSNDQAKPKRLSDEEHKVWTGFYTSLLVTGLTVADAARNADEAMGFWERRRPVSATYELDSQSDPLSGPTRAPRPFVPEERDEDDPLGG